MINVWLLNGTPDSYIKIKNMLLDMNLNGFVTWVDSECLLFLDTDGIHVSCFSKIEKTLADSGSVLLDIDKLNYEFYKECIDILLMA